VLLDINLIESLLLRPKETFSKMKKVDLMGGAKFAATSLLILLVVNVIFVALQNLVTGQAIGYLTNLALMASIKTIIVAFIGLLVLGYVASFVATRLFKGKTQASTVTGLVFHSAAVLLAIGVLTDILALVSSLMGEAFLSTFVSIGMLLAIISLLWMVFISAQAVFVSSKVNFNQAIISTVIGLIVAILVLVPVSSIANLLLGLTV
jgi:hypothetical protein